MKVENDFLRCVECGGIAPLYSIGYGSYDSKTGELIIKHKTCFRKKEVLSNA